MVGCCWSEGTCVTGPSATWGSRGQSSSCLDSTGGDNDLAVRTRARRTLSTAERSSAPPAHRGSPDAGSGLAYVGPADGVTEPQGSRNDQVTQAMTARLRREAGPPVDGVQALRLQPRATSVPCSQGLGDPVLSPSEPRGGIPICGRPTLWTGAPSQRVCPGREGTAPPPRIRSAIKHPASAWGRLRHGGFLSSCPRRAGLHDYRASDVPDGPQDAKQRHQDEYFL